MMEEGSKVEKERMLLEPGEMFGDYTVEKLLGRGGMGEVYLVRASDGAYYALKLMFPDIAERSPDFRKRFLREGEFARDIRHPNLLSVYEVGFDAATNLNYIVMEYASGGSVRDRLEKEGRFAIAEAVEITRQIAYGLAAAHQHGVVHRDIKPDNILFSEDGVPKLADLGVAKFTDVAHKTTMTTAGEVVGTPAYMAPEQMMNAHAVDARADIYALGVVFYEMLAGNRPNANDTYLQLLAKAVKGTPLPNVRKLRPEVSAALVQVINVMCAMRADDRFSSSQKLIDVFERLKREGLNTRLGLRQPPNHRRRRLIAISFLLGMAFLGAGAIAYDRTATFTEYFGDWVDEWGIPSGRAPLDAGVAKRREHYRFEYRGRHSFFGKRILRSVKKYEKLGFLSRGFVDMLEGRRPALMRIIYDEAGHLVATDYLRTDGNIALRCQYSGDGMRYIDFKLPAKDGGMVAAFVSYASQLEFEMKEKEIDDIYRIRRHVVTRDAMGRISKIEFMANDSNEPVADEEGFFGTTFERDEEGRAILIRRLGEDGAPASDPNGVTFITRRYDARGNQIETAYFDAETNAVLSADGFACQRTDFDEIGRDVRITYLGLDGRPCMTKEHCAGESWTYDEVGRSVRLVSLDAEGRPCHSDTRYTGGNVVGQLGVLTPERSIRSTWLDADMKPCVSDRGFAMVERKFDRYDREVESIYYDRDGHPVANSENYHRRRRIYDADGEVEEIQTFGTDGKLVKDHDMARAVLRLEYDIAGRVVCRTSLDENRRPCMGEEGAAKILLQYDTYGRVSHEKFLGEDGKPCESRYGYASSNIRYDSKGNRIRLEAFSPDGTPKLTIESDYDTRGHVIEERRYDGAGKPWTNGNARATSRYAYDANGRRIREDFYAADGTRVGLATHSQYDARGRKIVMDFIGTNGCPTIENSCGCARVRMRYDDMNTCIEQRMFDTEDRPMLNRPVSSSAFAGVFKITYAVDYKTGMKESVFFGLDEKPCLNSRGYGGVRSFEGQANKRIYLEFLGLGGRRQNLPKKAWGGGFFGFEQKFNHQGSLVMKMHFDEDYKYVMRGDECGFLQVFDPDGSTVTARLHLGTDGKPCKTSRGEWGWRMVSDEKAPDRLRRKPIADEKEAEMLFAQGTAAIVDVGNHFVEEWKKVRHEKVPKE